MAANTPARTTWLARVGGHAAWAGFVAAVAIAGAGLTLALDHPQNDSGRPELTAVGDRIVEPRLAALIPALTTFSSSADNVAAQARQTYGHIRARDTAAARADLTGGDTAATAVTSAAATVQSARAMLLDGTSIDAISAANRAWIAAIDQALASAPKVPLSWTVVADAAVLPISVLETLSDHDALVIAATGLARGSDFAGAITKLTDARADVARATDLAAQAAGKNLDASTLTGLITRSSDYDEALIRLYAILVQTGGVFDDEARTALDVVNSAEQALPKDTSALTVIVSDVGGQTITGALIDLEQLRGTIAAAVNRPGALSPFAGVASR